MKVILVLLGIAALALTAGCRGKLPEADDARTEFEERLQAQLGPKARVIDFRKLDGLRYVENGVQSYDLEFAAKVEAPGAHFEQDTYIGKVTFIRTENGWRMNTVNAESKSVYEAEQKRQRERVTASRLNQDLRLIEAGLNLYKLDNFMLPSEAQGLRALIEEPTSEPRPRNWKKDGYFRELPVDPWGNPYRYRQPGIHGEFDVYSLGADNTPGGDDENADVGSWSFR